MLRQLARLTLPVEAAGPRACAIAVYADAADRTFPAAELGFEGVACVDDAARAVGLLCDLWSATRLEPLRMWLEGLVDFLLFMQDDDGCFVNFIADWRGRRNDRGPTSFAGGGFWHARGLRALAKAWLVLEDERARVALIRGLPLVRDARDVPPDVRAIHAMMAAELLRAGVMPELRADLGRWADEISGFRRGAVLQDDHDQTSPHLWGHIQEGVLADTGALLDRPELIAIARGSALAYLAPLIEGGFDLPTVQPYGVASAIWGVDRLASVTGEPDFSELGRHARAWFDDRNPAGRAVYDRGAGRVHDGIDRGVLNRDSGAESNIAGATALLRDVTLGLPTLLPLIEGCFPVATRRRLRIAPTSRSA
jgi:hypothetical protein